ncbi:hypothetical protein [Geodermatophilus sp. URMC 63]
MRGEWAVWAGEAAPAVGIPVWLSIVLAVGGAANLAVLGWLGWLVSHRSHKLAVRKNHQDQILKAAELINNPGPNTHEQGMVMLEGIARMKDLSPEDVRLVKLLTRQGLERRLEDARQEQQRGRQPRFWRRA